MKIDRLIGILCVLLQKGATTAPQLAEQFEVSRRTINRDIEALCRAGIPIVTTQGAGGGIAIMEGYRVDRALLTGDDMRAILAGLRSLDSVSGTHRYAQLMEKMSAGASTMLAADDRILIDLSSWHGQALAEKIELIHGAIENQRLLSFHYHAPGGEGMRTVEPYYLVFQWVGWYCWAWCRDRGACRLFKLNRMTDVSMGEAFEARAVPPPDLKNERVFPENFTVRAIIDPKYRWRLIEEYGEDCFTERADGRLAFEHGFTDEAQAVTWMLSFEDGAEALAPVWLRKRLYGIGKRLRDIYQTDEKQEG